MSFKVAASGTNAKLPQAVPALLKRRGPATMRSTPTPSSRSILACSRAIAVSQRG